MHIQGGAVDILSISAAHHKKGALSRHILPPRYVIFVQFSFFFLFSYRIENDYFFKTD